MESLKNNTELTEQQREFRDRARSVGCWAGSNASTEVQKQKILEIFYELSGTGDVKEAISRIEKDKSIEGIEFTKRALIFGIEHSSYERELISRLLSAAYDIFEGGEILDGFQLLLYRLPDLILDVPTAPQILAKFISRALYDEILPPGFHKDAIVDNEHAKESLSLSYATTSNPIEKRRLQHVWGPGDLTSVEQLKEAVDALLKEYFENPNPVEAASSVKELNAPSFASQIVKQALRTALEKNTDDSRKNVIDLFNSWRKINLMSNVHFERGFANISGQLEDLKLDVPNAPQMFAQLVSQAIEHKLIPSSFGK
eukprot:TRINITY_DN13214_c0_g1_i1.p1 TRINITY_DN13214_c0_g1~~TRINITY_DN13214_c0_g1_i1.p1  ORF type:complete len:333 (-),score=86.46 TRINITY_DN13214_c0_g1_i1:55-996(-)